MFQLETASRSLIEAHQLARLQLGLTRILPRNRFYEEKLLDKWSLNRHREAGRPLAPALNDQARTGGRPGDAPTVWKQPYLSLERIYPAAPNFRHDWKTIEGCSILRRVGIGGPIAGRASTTQRTSAAMISSSWHLALGRLSVSGPRMKGPGAWALLPFPVVAWILYSACGACGKLRQRCWFARRAMHYAWRRWHRSIGWTCADRVYV